MSHASTLDMSVVVHPHGMPLWDKRSSLSDMQYSFLFKKGTPKMNVDAPSITVKLVLKAFQRPLGMSLRSTSISHRPTTLTAPPPTPVSVLESMVRLRIIDKAPAAPCLESHKAVLRSMTLRAAPLSARALAIERIFPSTLERTPIVDKSIGVYLVLSSPDSRSSESTEPRSSSTLFTCCASSATRST